MGGHTKGEVTVDTEVVGTVGAVEGGGEGGWGVGGKHLGG